MLKILWSIFVIHDAPTSVIAPHETFVFSLVTKRTKIFWVE